MRSPIGALACLLALSVCAGACHSGEREPRHATPTGPDAELRAPVCPKTRIYRGDARYYRADGSGKCSFPATPNDLMVAAMNGPQYDGAKSCGGCVHVRGPDGEVTVRIVDRCGGCSHGDLDLSAEAFARIAEPRRGRVPITWRYVPCDVSGPIEYVYKDGTNPWWAAIQVRNHRFRVARLEVRRGDNPTWRSLRRQDFNYFAAPGGFGNDPVAFRVTDVYGNTVVDAGRKVTEGGRATGSRQFPACQPR